ncbi:MAG: sigma-70 family RNA polymerase sigma factor [Actinomycetota bacterium]
MADANEECRRILDTARSAAAMAGASADTADEIAQRVAYNLHRKWDSDHVRRARGKGEQYWLNYIRRSAINAYRDLLRSEQRREKRERRANFDDGPPPEPRPGVQRHQDHEPSAIDELLGRMHLVDLVHELLRGRQLQVALLHLVDGLSVTEIAERLGIHPRSVREHRTKGLTKLKEHLAPDTSNEDDVDDQGGEG